MEKGIHLKVFLPILIITVLVVGGGSFYGGMKYQQASGTSARSQQFGNGQQRSASGNKSFGGMTSGEVLSKDDKSITVKLRDGGSKIILTSDSTTVSKSATGAMSDIEIGKTIMVNGTTNTDGSITAKSIQIPSGDALAAPPEGRQAPSSENNTQK